jgi:hypothetical protein
MQLWLITKRMKVQKSFWTCHEHDVIITICCGFDELSEMSFKKQNKLFF